jgi:universal stress protein E
MPASQSPTILVAVAVPEERAQPAIERALPIALHRKASIVLFHAAYESCLSGRPFFDSYRLAASRGELVEQRRLQLERHARWLRARGIDTTTIAVWEEPVHAAVVAAAIRENASLVIIGAHRPRVGQPLSLRHSDWELLRACPRPLLIVGARPGKSEGAVVAALDPQHLNDKPAALDAALAMEGAALAEALQAEFHVAHCIPSGAYPLGPITAADRKRMAQRMRASLRSTLRKSATTARKIHLLHGQVEKELPTLVAQLGAQVVVLGALSRRGLQQLVVGNTAERLIHAVPCDLLIVKPPGFKVKLSRSRKQSVTRRRESRDDAQPQSTRASIGMSRRLRVGSSHALR